MTTPPTSALLCASAILAASATASAQSFSDRLVQPPTFDLPKRGAVTGSLSDFAVEPDHLSRGSLSLPLPIELPSERGSIGANVIPAYAPDGGLTEWGSGVSVGLAIRRHSLTGDVAYGADEFTSPWGRLVGGTDGAYYVSGLQNRTRFVRGAAGWTATAPDGAVYTFAERQPTSRGDYAWYLTSVQSVLGDRTTLHYTANSTGRRFLSRVVYGSRGFIDSYRVDFEYAMLGRSFPSHASGDRVDLDRRVSRVSVKVKDAVSGVHRERYAYDLTYGESTLSPVFYLASIQRTFASGDRDPAVSYTYRYGDDVLGTAALRPIPGIQGYLLAAGSVAIQPDKASPLDLDDDGLIDLEHHYEHTLVHQTPDGWTFEALPPNPSAHPSCRGSASVANPPRHLARMTPDEPEPRVLATHYDASALQTSVLICDRGGDVLSSVSLAGAWELDANTRFADLDRDRRPDLIKVWAGSAQLMQNTSSAGSYAFAPRPTQSLTPSVVPTASWIRDLNGDGVGDLVVQHGAGLIAWYGRGDFQWEPNGQALQFVDAQGVGVGELPTYGTYFVDANNDGLEDVLLTRSTSALLFINQVDHFAQVAVPGLAVSGSSFSDPVLLDLRGDGDTEVVYTAGTQAFGLALNEAGTGLLAAVDDGRGVQMSFEYAWSEPAPGGGQRVAVLGAVTHAAHGVDPVTQRFTYRQPVAHSEGRFLVGFGVVTSETRDDRDTIRFVNDDWTSGLTSSSRGEEQVGADDIYQFTENQYDARTYLGVPWHRLRSQRTGWGRASDGFEIATTTETTRYEREICAVDQRSSLPAGALITRTTLTPMAALPGFGAALACLPAIINRTGVHPDSSLDFRESLELSRNALGQLTAATLQGSQGTLTTQTVSYDPLNRIASVSSPGRGATTIAYDPGTGLPVTGTGPDGVVRALDDLDPISDVALVLTEWRDGVGAQAHASYDGRERLIASWRNDHGMSAAMPLATLVYADGTATTYGTVHERTLVDERTADYRETVSVVAADGSDVGTLELAPGGWIAGPLSSVNREFRIHRQLLHQAPLAGIDPRKLEMGDLFVGAMNTIVSTAEDPFGRTVYTEDTVEQGIQRTRDTVVAVSGTTLQLTTETNGQYPIVAFEDAAGNVVARQDALGFTTRYGYDALGRLRRVQLPNGRETYALDYDDYGRVAKTTNSSSGMVARSYDPTTGLLSRAEVFGTTGAQARQVVWTYDAIGRVVREHHTDVSTGRSSSFDYDYDGLGIPEPGQRGRLTRVTGPAFERETAYDAQGNVARARVRIGNWRQVELVYERFASGEVRSVTRRVLDAGGGVLEQDVRENVLDTYGRVTTVVLNGAPIAKLYYDALGRMDRASFGGGAELVQWFDWETQKLAGYQLDNGAQISGADWQHDDRGLVRRERTWAGGVNWDRRYTYEDRGFLAEQLTVGGSSDAWSYDDNGLISDIKDQRGARTLHPWGRWLFAGSSVYRFDDLGRVVARDGVSMSYGPFGTMDEARVGTDLIEFSYDETGNRVLKRRNGVPEVGYVAGGYLSSAGFVEPFSLGGRVVGAIANGQLELLDTDMRGSVMADPFGSAHELSAYGVRATHPAISEAIDFAEKGHDPDLKVVRMGVRDYDPFLGRFLTPDPLFLEQPDMCLSNPAECNLYGYAANNPISFTDPTGTNCADADGTPCSVDDKNLLEDPGVTIETTPHLTTSSDFWTSMDGRANFLRLQLEKEHPGSEIKYFFLTYNSDKPVRESVWQYRDTFSAGAQQENSGERGAAVHLEGARSEISTKVGGLASGGTNTSSTGVSRFGDTKSQGEERSVAYAETIYHFDVNVWARVKLKDGSWINKNFGRVENRQTSAIRSAAPMPAEWRPPVDRPYGVDCFPGTGSPCR